MSGGLDSSAAAFLLKKQGYEVMGVFMRLGFGDNEGENAARRVCQKLGIKFYPLNLASKFKKEIIDYFLKSYEKGLTPNPCVKCNKIIKFKELFKKARELGADYIATGHYAQKHENKNIFKLFCGEDEGKDQSYFLYNLTQGRLKHILFPLGKYKKDEVRKIADRAGLSYLKKESQDVCFLAGDHNDFLKDNLKLKPGEIKTLANQIVGQHQGLPLYTIGQRKGVEIGGTGPYYVAECDYKTNILWVVKKGDDPALYKDELIARDVNWISGIEPKLPLTCLVAIRYGHKPTKCKIQKSKGKINEYLIKFEKPQRAITPGQSVVFYLPRRSKAKEGNENEVLGGGVIGNCEL